MKLFKLIILILSISIVFNHELTPCTDHCNPDDCQVVSNESCEFPAEVFDMIQDINDLPCNDCTQVTTGFCSTLAATLETTNNNIISAYCTDEFLVIWSTGFPHHDDDTLGGIPRPPGGDGQYEQACVVREAQNQHQTYKIPLSPTKLADGQTNDLPGYDSGIELPLAGAIGVAINGVPIYPAVNNRDEHVWLSCEVDKCNAHAGKGQDYHYHGDPYGSECMYTHDAYHNEQHPHIIGFSADGFTIHGRYSNDAQQGQAQALDRCGGHDHDGIGYHYHSQVEQFPASGDKSAYTGYFFGPKDCWAGDISQIDSFWNAQNNQIEYDNSKNSPRYNIYSRNDIQKLRPCCTMTESFSISGITFQTQYDPDWVPPVIQNPEKPQDDDQNKSSIVGFIKISLVLILVLLN